MAPKKVMPKTACSLLRRILFVCGVGLVCFGFSAHGALQFDAFLGYEDVIPERSWFPISCEIYNDGPAFNADIQISTGDFTQSQTRHFAIDLPPGTRKRVFIPVFSSASVWNVRLVDESGHVREERALDTARPVGNGLPVFGAVVRTASGLPVFPEMPEYGNNFKFGAARIQPDFFPDNPLALEGLDLLYLSSEKAANFTVGQVNALLAWLQDGGHLVLGIEDATDVNGTPWLRELLPFQVSGSINLASHDQLQVWTRKTVPNARPGESGFLRYHHTSGNYTRQISPDDNAADDANFGAQPMLVATGRARDGQVVIDEAGTPLMIESRNLRGRITVLTFSPEREPFISWKNRMWFWARLAEIPTEMFQEQNPNFIAGRQSSDGIFGAMIDTKQVRKLPLGWLLVLLVAYLVVIGPFDQYWLKKINRQMLTWITFPCYVVIFSALIYYIGFRLRAGELEWNELSIVDVLPDGEQSVLRGQTYVSIYSPNNAHYELAGHERFSTLRGEYLGNFGGNQEASRSSIAQVGNDFEASVFVPVWTSQLFVSDWVQPSGTPVSMSVAPHATGWTVNITNNMDRPLSHARAVLGKLMFDLGDLAAGEGKAIRLEVSNGTDIGQWAGGYATEFRNAVQARHSSFGNNNQTIDDPIGASMAASFLSFLGEDNSQGWNTFTGPSSLDLSRYATSGNGILLAWDAGEGLSQPLNQFHPKRLHRNTLLRLVVPVKG